MDTQKKLDDILPAYNEYLNYKIKYQLGELDETPMLGSFKFLCQELQDFILSLYSGTDTYKERKGLQATLKKVQSKMQ